MYNYRVELYSTAKYFSLCVFLSPWAGTNKHTFSLLVLTLRIYENRCSKFARFQSSFLALTLSNLNLSRNQQWSGICSRISSLNQRIVLLKLSGGGDPPSLSSKTAADGFVWLPILKNALKLNRLSRESRFVFTFLFSFHFFYHFIPNLNRYRN